MERIFQVKTQNEEYFKHEDGDNDVPLPPQRKLPSSPCYRRTSDERIKTEMSPLPKTLSHVERYVFFSEAFLSNQRTIKTHTHTHHTQNQGQNRTIETHEKQEKLGVSGDSECGGEIC